MSTSRVSNPSVERRADLDALRVGAIYLLFLFHVAKIYDPRPFQHYWSPDLIPGLDEITGVFVIWRMPLLFLIAGWSAVLSFRSRGLAVFLRERVRRIALPLFFGAVFLCPLIKYIELRSGVYMGLRGRGATAALQEAHGSLQAYALPIIEPYAASFYSFLPKFYTSLSFFTWSHLWFLVYLLVFTSIAAPLLARIADAPAKPARYPLLWLCFPAFFLAVSEAVLRPHWPNNLTLINDWANMARYSLYFLIGIVWARHGVLGKLMRELWPYALTAAVLLFTTHKLLAGGLASHATVQRLVVYGLPAAAGWFFILFLLGITARFMERGSPLLATLSGTVLPVYILHQPIIIVTAYFLDDLALHVSARLVLIFCMSLIVTLAIVRGPAQRFAILRAGFGLGASAAASWGAAVSAALFVAMVLLISSGNS